MTDGNFDTEQALTETDAPKTRRKRRSFGVRWRILAYLFAFVAVVIALVWLFQIFLLDNFYGSIMTSRLEDASIKIGNEVQKLTADGGENGVIAHQNKDGSVTVYGGGRSVVESLDTEKLTSLVGELSAKYELCVSVYYFVDRSGYRIADSHISYGCMLHNIDSESLTSYYMRARESDDGVYVRSFDLDAFADSIPDSVLYTRAVVTDDGGDAVVFLNCSAAPVSSTVEALKIQLLWITIITLLLAAALAGFIAWHVSAPILDVNREAKALSSGRYDGGAVRGGYREIDELSNTLTQASLELTKADRMQKELIANVSHDLRTPLTLIEGYTEMMRDIPDENTPENMQIVIDETHRLSTLVSDLLELSRFGTGRQQLTLAKFDLGEAVTETVERVDKLYGADGYRILYEPTDEPVIVNADKTRILQVIYNLIGNAVNYTGEDKTVSVAMTLSDGFVRVSVTDTGEGIAKEDLPLIWDRYYKVDKTHRRGVGGSGLGLSIVKEILLLHNARFGVSSTVGAGSTFWFELPIEG